MGWVTSSSAGLFKVIAFSSLLASTASSLPPRLSQPGQHRAQNKRDHASLPGLDLHYLWRAVDHVGEVLEAYVTRHRDRKAALRFLRRTMKRYGNPNLVVTDRLGSYKAAMKLIGNAGRQETGRWLNNRAENSHIPFRRRERSMGKFGSFETLQKFVSAQSSVQNHFSQERHLNRRETFKQNRSTALAEWRQIAA